jgi:hypothetical protein
MIVYVNHMRESAYPADPSDCVSDGSATVLTRTWSWDGVTLDGTVETVRGNRCGGRPAVDQVPVALIRLD